ncbi:hypothetical protein LFT63_08160 [Staphylococcus sp. FSL H8-0121]|uniref:hypothetical protein n=1 Tax=Staphylococcus sp. FSL H8-0121 TaxID=2921377 RepID=UPI0030F4F3B3
MIFVMLSPLFIVGFIALSIYEEKRRKKNQEAKNNQNENHIQHQTGEKDKSI